MRAVSSAIVLLSAALVALASPHEGRRDHTGLVKRMGDQLEKRGGYTNARFTWYPTDTGADACTGKNHKDSDWYVALNMPLFGYSGSGNGHCMKQIKITAKGKSTVATIVDACATCYSDSDIDMTKGLFEFFDGNPDDGVFYGSWEFVDGSDSGSGGGGNSGGGSQSSSSHTSQHTTSTKTSSTTHYTPTTTSKTTTHYTPTTTSKTTSYYTPTTTSKTTSYYTPTTTSKTTSHYTPTTTSKTISHYTPTTTHKTTSTTPTVSSTSTSSSTTTTDSSSSTSTTPTDSSSSTSTTPTDSSTSTSTTPTDSSTSTSTTPTDSSTSTSTTSTDSSSSTSSTVIYTSPTTTDTATTSLADVANAGADPSGVIQGGISNNVGPDSGSIRLAFSKASLGLTALALVAVHAL